MSTTFKTTTGTEFTIRLSLALADSVQTATGVDILPEAGDVHALVALVGKYRVLGNVLWECCKAEATAKGMDRTAFMESMDSQGLFGGWDALIAAYIEWQANKNPAMATAIKERFEAELAVMEKGAERMLEMIRSPETQQAIDRAVAEMGADMQSILVDGLATVHSN